MTKIAVAIILLSIVGGTLFSSYQSLAKKQVEVSVLAGRVMRRDRLERALSQGSINVAATKLIRKGAIITRADVYEQRQERGFSIGTYRSINDVVGCRLEYDDIQKDQVITHIHVGPREIELPPDNVKGHSPN